MSECKPTSELLSAIQGADTKVLKDVTPVENPAAKHDMAMVGVIFILWIKCVVWFFSVWSWEVWQGQAQDCGNSGEECATLCWGYQDGQGGRGNFIAAIK